MKTAPPDVRKHNKRVPESFVAIIDRMLAKKADDRYQTPAELLHDLENPDEVVLQTKRGTSNAKTGRSSRMPTNHPTEDIDDPEPEDAIEEPKPMKVSRLKRPLGTRKEDKDRVKAIDIPAPRPPRDEDVNEDDDSTPDIAKKSGKDTPIWVFAAGGGVGVVVLFVILAIVFGGRTPPPPPPKEPEKGKQVVNDKPPVVVQPPPIVVKIDTSPAKMSAARFPGRPWTRRRTRRIGGRWFANSMVRSLPSRRRRRVRLSSAREPTWRWCTVHASHVGGGVRRGQRRRTDHH